MKNKNNFFASLLVSGFLINSTVGCAQQKTEATTKDQISAEEVTNGEVTTATQSNLDELNRREQTLDVSYRDFAEPDPKQKSPAGGNNQKVVVVVSRAQQSMTVFVNGKEYFSTPVGTGIPHSDTMTPASPKDGWQPGEINARHFSNQFHAVLAYAIQAHGGIYLHAASEGAMYYINRKIPHSHGCVRIPETSAIRLFKLVQSVGRTNTRIIIR